LTWPFQGLPLAIEIYFAFTLALIVFLFAWTASLFFRGRRAAGDAPEPADPDAFRWVFIVPALNEEVTIRDSVERLLGLELGWRRVIVVDDGSDDGTPSVLAGISHPDLVVLRRVPPDARQGKAEALNHAYRQLGPLLGDHPRDRVVVAIVDADGRLHPDAPGFAAAHLAEPEVGGVQSLVRIYNRERLLGWFQDVEFSIYGRLFQAGRNHLGTAGMGGNGQFNRLSALDRIVDGSGPWRDRLTEDQDLGLRLIAAGSLGRQELRATVDQQGLSSLRPLFRQRTRWAQGNVQAMGLIGDVWRSPLGLVARLELLLHLLTPLWQTIIGISLLISIVLALTDVAAFWDGGPLWELVFFYLLGFGTVVFGCIAARAQNGAKGMVEGFLIAQPYAFYSWLLWPVLVRAMARQLTERREWSKTEREPLRA
jgi:cellulose synthase/poly-beta-1,6-N-acetylglucosamine synthase-like glycosyltransferase